MEKLRQFRDSLFQLKGYEATWAWKAIVGVWKIAGRFGRWLLTVPGAILGILVALFWSIVGVVAAAPGFAKGLLFKAPKTGVAVLAAIGTVLLSLVLLVWWWVLPGFISGVGFITVMWAICEASGWMIKVGCTAGVLVGLWFYWNVLAASLATWKPLDHFDRGDYLADAAARMFYGMLVEFGVFAYITFLIENTLVVLAASVIGLMLLWLLIAAIDLLTRPL